MLCGVVLSQACRDGESGGRRRLTSDMRAPSDAAQFARSCDELTCNEPAHCVEGQSEGQNKPHCVCPTGFQGDPDDCQDVDECATASAHSCNEHALCTNRDGGYDCACKAGYIGDGHNCAAADSCSDDADRPQCHPDAFCTNGDDGPQCECRSGYQGDGQACSDVDECQSGQATCPDHAVCENKRGSYGCRCDVPFEGDGKSSCRDSCEIALTDHARCDAGGHGRCSFDMAGQASCTSCRSDSLGDGRSCTADGECERLKCGDNTVCAGDAGSRRCECAKGFKGDAQAGCEDIDECQDSGACTALHSNRCLNVPGGFVCACEDGFERVNGACVNVNECDRDLDLCDPAANCVDTTPGYRCECKSGYEGDGRSCADVDECQKDPNACAGSQGTVCKNTAGAFQCVCPDGYLGDGKNEACACDLSGYWGSRIDTVVKLNQLSAGDVVLISSMMMHTTVWELSRYHYDGNEIKIENVGCGMSDDPEIYSPLYNEVYSLTIPTSSYDKLSLTPVHSVPLARSDALPGRPFVSPREAVLQGVQMADPLNDPWPDSFQTVPANFWVDYDLDSAPGVTFWPASTERRTRRGTDETYNYLPVELKAGSSLVGERVGCVSTGIRAIRSFKGGIESCGRITGTMDIERFDIRVQGCTVVRMSDWDSGSVSCDQQDWEDARACSVDQLKFIDDQDLPYETGGKFEFVKLAGLDATGVDCAKVRAALPALTRP
jgi:hypothetical protein